MSDPVLNVPKASGVGSVADPVLKVLARQRTGRRPAKLDGSKNARAVPKEAAPNAARWAPGTWVGKRYQVESRLGRGGFGETWLAWDVVLARRVAIKRPRFDFRRSGPIRDLLSEARLAARCAHPNLVQVYDFGAHEALPHIVMEYVDGTTLADLVGPGKALSSSDALRIVGGVLQALASLHSAGVVHGDVSPSNVIVDAAGRVRLADFGSAMGIGTPASVAPSTGSPSFMSPEAAEGDALTEESDVYSAGALLYFLLAGRPYLRLDGLSGPEMRMAIRTRHPVPLTGVASQFAALPLMALAKAPSDRPRSAAAYWNHLSGFIPRGTPSTSGPLVRCRRPEGGPLLPSAKTSS